MSTQIISAWALILSQILPLVGIHLGNVELENLIQSIIGIVAPLWIWYQRTTLVKAGNNIGDVTALGVRRS